MEKYFFTDAYIIGNKIIDSQHEKLFEIFDKLFEAMSLAKDRQIISIILEELLNYSNYHFDAEETIMKEINYPYYDQHKDEHEVFISEVKGLISTYKSGNYDVTVKTLDFLYYWILNHILASDKKISNFIKNKL